MLQARHSRLELHNQESNVASREEVKKLRSDEKPVTRATERSTLMIIEQLLSITSPAGGMRIRFPAKSKTAGIRVRDAPTLPIAPDAVVIGWGMRPLHLLEKSMSEETRSACFDKSGQL
jgi:hypothetical protein